MGLNDRDGEIANLRDQIAKLNDLIKQKDMQINHNKTTIEMLTVQVEEYRVQFQEDFDRETRAQKAAWLAKEAEYQRKLNEYEQTISSQREQIETLCGELARFEEIVKQQQAKMDNLSNTCVNL